MIKSELVNDVYLAHESNYTKGRNGYKVCKITPHMMGGILSAKQCCVNVFQKPERNASCNYCIGNKGDIALCVSEEDRAWTSSSRTNDFQAITIEVSNCENGGDWKVSDEAWNSLVALCVDICKRYEFRLVYDGTKNGSLTEHRMFANTNCLPLSTELLTREGWVKLEDIKIGDEVASADLDNLNITFEEVYDKVIPKIQDTYTCNDLTATKDHRMVYSVQSSKTKYKIDEFKKIIGRSCYIPLAGTNNFKGLNLTDDMIKFYIAVQADGHYIRENQNYCGLEFHLKKERKIVRIKNILDNIKLPYTISNKSDGSVSIRVWNFEDVNVVKDICEKFLLNKNFTWEWINLNKEQAELFLNEILLWNGCVNADKYTSTKQINLDIVNAIASLNNKGSRIIGSDVIFRDIPYITLNCEAKRNIEARPRTEKVSCVSVKTGLILIRQNGKTFIVGNCPGNYLHGKMSELANAVNSILDGKEYVEPVKVEVTEQKQEVQNGNSSIRTIQYTLNRRYNVGLVEDGIYGKNTKKALVKGLQTEINNQYGKKLSVDGIFGNNTKNACVTLRNGSKGNITYIMQAILLCRGYSLSVDKVFGNETLSVVKKFQADNNLVADGIVGKNTWGKLFN